ncbi:MAG: vanadium-dependent haloperoxidase [Gammaproteobacteria bacterium]|nr:vanadium-dependent haloperoxidase [Gammaproteobacteria bacterium]
MQFTRRRCLLGAGAIASFPLLHSCVSPFSARYGNKGSYLTKILEPKNQNALYYWIDVVMQQIRDQRLFTPRAAYIFGLTNTAGFLAANGITQSYQEPFDMGTGPADADVEIAYGVAFAIAASEVLQQPLVFERRKFLAQYPGSSAKTNAVRWGNHVARKLLKRRTNDGSEDSEVNYYLNRYKRRGDALQWSPTGPFYGARPGPAFESFDRPLYPGHGMIKPWTMTHGSQFRASDFYDPKSHEFAEAFQLIKDLGGTNSTVRTEDESEIALFWENGPWGATVPGHFMYIAIQVLQHRALNFVDLAKAFALLGMTQCDASINAWDNKYHYDILRPETAIRVRANNLGNSDPRVRNQSDWHSFIPTPEFPSYTSGHSTFGGAASETLKYVCGRDDVAFSGYSPDQVLWPQLEKVSRHWNSFTQMAEENGMSRIYGGVHWSLDNTEALKAGRLLARHATETMFLPKI